MESQSCLLCHNSLDGKILLSEVLEHTVRVFNNCCQYLTKDLLKESWNSQEDSRTPLCSTCFQFGEQLLLMNEALHEIKREIQTFVQSYVSSARKVRKLLMSPSVPVQIDLATSSSTDYHEEISTKSGERPNCDESSNSVSGERPNCDESSNSVSGESVIVEEDNQGDIEIKYETRSDPAASPSRRPSISSSSTARQYSQSNTNNRSLYSCEACNKHFPSNYELQVHYSEHVGTVQMFSCDYCGDGFFSLNSLRKHQLEHGEAGQKCPNCFLPFFHLNNLDRHKLTCQPQRCQACGENLAIHSTSPHICVKKGLVFDCKLCGESLRSRVELLHHEETVHSLRQQPREHKCVNCGLKFGSGKDYKQHRLSHLKEPNFCLMCNQIFPSRNHLRQHFADNHIV